MAVVHRSSATTKKETAGGSVTASFPSGLTSGDLMIMAVYSTGYAIANPSGWTKIVEKVGSPYRYVFRKIADSTDVSTGSVTVSSSSTNTWYGVVSISSFYGYRTDNPINAYSSNPDIIEDDATPSINNTITPFPESMLMMICFNHSDDGSSSSGYAIQNNNPSWTEIVDIQQYDTGNGNQIGVAIATRPEYSATGNSSYTIDNYSDISKLYATAILLAITNNRNFTITESLSVSDSKTQGIKSEFTEILSLSDSFLSKIERIWTGISKVASTWINKNKN